MARWNPKINERVSHQGHPATVLDVKGIKVQIRDRYGYVHIVSRKEIAQIKVEAT